MGEFELIARHFLRGRERTPGLKALPAAHVLLGIGDDCAILEAGGPLAVSTDMLVEGRHFFSDVDPESLGHKCLAVNLSDLAAMGARPMAYTLALALLPERASDDGWLSAFARGMHALADEHACILVGGDTTAGPLTISITVMGALAQPLALRRSAALVGDDIYVTGTLGGAARALDWILARQALPKALRDCLERPTPRVAMGMALATLAHACIDVSDGLAGDLGHILAASGVGATVELNALPVSPYLHDLAAEDVWRHALAGGDDYELCFTASPERASQVLAAGQQLGVQVTRVGRVTALLSPTEIEAQSAVQSNASAIAWTLDGEPVKLALSGFDHFVR